VTAIGPARPLPLALGGLIAGSVLAALLVPQRYALPLFVGLAVAAAFALGLINWRYSAYGLLAYLPVSGVPILISYPQTALPVLLKDFLFVLPVYLGFLLARRRRWSFERAPVAGLAILAAAVLLQCFNPALRSPAVPVIQLRDRLMSWPQSEYPGGTPRPRNESAANVITMTAISSPSSKTALNAVAKPTRASCFSRKAATSRS